MTKSFTCQGRVVHPADIQLLQLLIDDHPSWSLYRIACELCAIWNWATPTGQIKDFAARSFLIRLMSHNIIILPPVRIEQQKLRGYTRPEFVPDVPFQQTITRRYFMTIDTQVSGVTLQ